DEGEPRSRGRAAHRVIQRFPLSRWGVPTDPREVFAKLVAEGLSPDEAETTRVAEAVAHFLAAHFARRVRCEAARPGRARAVVLDWPAGTRGVGGLALRGAMDLVVEQPSGRIDLIDYKLARARSELAVYEFELRASALAVQGGDTAMSVRAGVVFLGG